MKIPMSVFLAMYLAPLVRNRTSLLALSVLKSSLTDSLGLPTVSKAAHEAITRLFRKRHARSAIQTAVIVRVAPSTALGATRIANSQSSLTISASNSVQKVTHPSMAYVKDAKVLARTALKLSLTVFRVMALKIADIYLLELVTQSAPSTHHRSQ